MSFISCDWLEHGIIFDHYNVIRVCCSQCHEGGGRKILLSGIDGGLIDWDELFEKKRKMRDIHRSGDICESCRGCISLHEGNWDEEDYIDNLLLTHWTDCNCKCIYCRAVRDEVLKDKNKHYDIIPILKDMMDRKILKKSASITIAGGEASIYREFEELLHLFLDYGCNDILLNTSGIKYSPAVAKGLSDGRVRLRVSVDAGTPEIHKQIKLEEVYDRVMNNLAKYVKMQGDNYTGVCTKFIICPGVNDTENEITLWLENAAEIGIRSAAVDIDFQWIQAHIDELEKYKRLYELIKFATKIADREGIKLSYDERASIMRQIHRVKTAVFGGTLRKLK